MVKSELFLLGPMAARNPKGAKLGPLARFLIHISTIIKHFNKGKPSCEKKNKTKARKLSKYHVKLPKYLSGNSQKKMSKYPQRFSKYLEKSSRYINIYIVLLF